MSKIAKKIIGPIILIIAIVILAFILINSFFVQGYLLKQYKNRLNEVYETVLRLENDSNQLQKIEQKYNISIIFFDNSNDEQVFNARLRDQFLSHNIGFTKLWLWTDDFYKVQDGESVIKLYNQQHLRYSILVRYQKNDGGIHAIVMNVPHTDETINIINRITMILLMCSGIVIILTIIVIVRKITKPITTLSQVSQQIAKQNFEIVNIHTGDEVEILADNFNIMSQNLKIAHHKLEQKNKTMKQLLADVSHEIKTPIALIKAYGQGMKDEMDDGNFLNIILKQNNKMNDIVEKLLQLSRYETFALQKESFDISIIFAEIMQEIEALLEERSIEWENNIPEDIYILADKKQIENAFLNLFSNAIKYALSWVTVELVQSKDTIKIQIENDISSEYNIQIKSIFDSFYIGEPSRNKMLTGSGLGLPIVKAIFDAHGYDFTAQINENIFSFCVWIK